jgi:hypothetical protein
MQWADDQRLLLPWPDYTVIHLGEARVNWNGRTTDMWQTNDLDYLAFQRAAEEHYRGCTAEDHSS